MKRITKNEQGYALITVLLILIIFMAVLTSLMGQSLNTVKQNQSTETNNLSVSMAEMGTNYYQAMIQNVYEKNKNDVSNYVLSKINSDRNNHSLKPESEYELLASKKMIEVICQSINSDSTKKEPQKMDDNPNAYYQIISCEQDQNDSNLLVLKVEGNSEAAKGFLISTKIKITPTVHLSQENDEKGEDSPILSLVFSPSISIPINTEQCKKLKTIASNTYDFSNKLKELAELYGNIDSSALTHFINDLTNIIPILNNPDNDKFWDQTDCVLTDGSETFSPKNNLSNKTIYSTGPLILDGNGNVNNMSKVNLHSEDSLTINGNDQNASDVIMETRNDATFTDQLDISESTDTPNKANLYVGGNLFVQKNFTLSNYAKAYIGGNVNIEGKLTIGPNALLCVAGDIYVDHKTQGSTENIITPKSDLDLQKKCGFKTQQNDNNVSWQESILEKSSYNYGN